MSALVEEINDDEDVGIVERVAAIDVAKATGMVCTRVPHPTIPGRRTTKVWEVSSTTNAILGLAGQLVGAGVERVVVESTSDYGRPFLYLLQAAGLTVWLVNTRNVKQVPGRPKTDKIDSVWLAKLNERGMLRASFVSPVEIRQLGDYTRLRLDLTVERSRHKQRVEKLLEDADQTVRCCVRHFRGVWPGDDRSVDRRGTRPDRACRDGQGQDATQAEGAG